MVPGEKEFSGSAVGELIGTLFFVSVFDIDCKKLYSILENRSPLQKMRKKNAMKTVFVLLVLLVVGCGCSTGVGIVETSPEERKYYSVSEFSADTLDGSTVNVLGNYQLTDLYEKAPAELITVLEQLYRTKCFPEIVTALADASLQIGYRMRKSPDEASRYFLAAALYSCMYLKSIDNAKMPYDEQRIRMIRIYDLAATELFCYLKKRNLERKSGYELALPGVTAEKVAFSRTEFQLPVAEKNIADFAVCADFRTVNFTHDSKVFGAGVPLVATLREECMDTVGLPLRGFPIPATLVMDFSYDPASSRIRGVLRYVYPRTKESIAMGDRVLPLAADFSTPLAKGSAIPQKMNFLSRTLNVQEASDFTGLYLFEPYDDKRIPVVFVHGLMSDVRTWGQMLNTLLHDKAIRRKYQFLGFEYSSGNPVFVSAAALRKSLHELRETLVRQNRPTENFDKMVLVGHSMGGLLCRLQVSSCTARLAADFMGIRDVETLAKNLPEGALDLMKRNLNFDPSPFVKRVVFIAVPHRGSEIARSWVGALGASLVKLPVDLVRLNVNFFRVLRKSGQKDLIVLEGHTGIDNLRPDAPALKFLSSLKRAGSIPCHSIMGNREKAFTPGGTDGVVPYWSSHLDDAASELIVQSGHSAHRSPLAIQEVRQILLFHAGAGKFTTHGKILGKDDQTAKKDTAP